MNVINDNLTLKNINPVVGNIRKIIIATAIINEKAVSVTWDCIDKNLVVHNWYDLTDSELAELTATLTEWFTKSDTSIIEANNA